MTQLNATSDAAATDRPRQDQLPRWMRVCVPIVPAGLTFGPLLMVIPSGSIIAYAGALLVGISLVVVFGIVMRPYAPRA